MNDKKKNKLPDNSIKTKNLHYLRMSLGLGVVILLSFLYPERIPFQVTEYEVGDIAKKDIIAPFNFPVLFSSEELKQKKKRAREKVIPVFNYNQPLTKKMISRSNTLFSSIGKLYSSRHSDSSFNYIVKTWPQGINEETLNSIKSDINKKFRKSKIFLNAKGLIKSNLQKFYTKGIINHKKILDSDLNRLIHLKTDRSTKLQISLNDLISLNQAYEKTRKKLRNLYPKKPEIAAAWLNIFKTLLHVNVTYNMDETILLQNNTISQVPISQGIRYKGEKIIDAHKRVTKDDVNILHSLALAKKEKEISENIWGIFYPLLGRLISSVLAVGLFTLYLIKYRPLLYKKISLLFLLSIIFFVIAISASLSASIEQFPKYLIPLTLGSMLVTILFDIETAFVYTVIGSLLIGNIQGFDYKLSLVSLVAGLIAILSVIRVRHRKEFFRPMIFIPLAYCVVIFMIGLLSFSPLNEIARDCGYGVVNGIISTIVAIGILPVCESIFKISTDITLLELSDLNHPLLKRLSLESPGTYQHSMLVGTLAEAGAEVIGANSLLARVGCYYHDIGKMNKPEYFAENQRDIAKSKHNTLNPSMSKTIILAHTKNGIDLAKQYKLPQCIIDFIPQHQGTTLVQYFYQKALENRKDSEIISEEDFRYPGPKPQIKETAIAMIADSVEAASRSLKNPTTSSLKGMVDKIIEGKFRDAQFDECDLTFKGLTKIRDRFVHVLTGIFHSRVAYPENKKGTEVSPVKLKSSVRSV